MQATDEATPEVGRCVFFQGCWACLEDWLRPIQRSFTLFSVALHRFWISFLQAKDQGMKMNILRLMIAGFMTAGTWTAASAEMSKVGEEAMIEAGRIMYQYRCRSCHSDTGTNPSYGPPLKKIIGRKAGSVVGFNYSKALANADFVWDEDKLREWIKNNKEMMPGTRMRHVGITDPAEQSFILEYIKHISE